MNSCLVTIHHDNRVRLWSLEDGRCFNISSHFLFRCDEEITDVKPINEVESRYLACISKKRISKGIGGVYELA